MLERFIVIETLFKHFEHGQALSSWSQRCH